MAEKDFSRRELFTFWRRKPEGRDDRGKKTSLPSLLRPPGALAEEDFLATCQRCGRCMQVCPRQAIGPVPTGPAQGTPFLVVRQAPCVVCVGLQCTHYCPSGALQPLDDPLLIRMGTAVLDAAKCLAHQGQECAACVNICPIPGALAAVAAGDHKVPAINVDRCVGCGLCENFCPPEPAAIHVIPRR